MNKGSADKMKAIIGFESELYISYLLKTSG